MKISATAILSFTSLARLFVGGTAALGDSVGPTFDYNTPLAGNNSTCAVISILMDESGSMFGEQAFMRDEAAPAIAQSLINEGINNVFFCSYGYGSDFAHINPASRGHFHGCSEGADLTIMDWDVTFGSIEDSFEVSNFAIESLPATINGKLLSDSCSSLALNMILVTDEDSDHLFSFSLTDAEVLAKLQNAGWKMNIIGYVAIQNDALGVSRASNSSGSILYTADGSGSFIELTSATIPEDTVSMSSLSTSTTDTSAEDYSLLAFGTNGALWDLSKLRSGGLVADSFTAAFIAIKVQEIVEDALTEMPSAVPSAKPSSTPSGLPSAVPSAQPSSVPSGIPSVVHSSQPSSTPSVTPSAMPSSKPSSTPSVTPSAMPSSKPSSTPSRSPSAMPSAKPSSTPSATPSAMPSFKPSSTPSGVPSATPSSQPSHVPSSTPSELPSEIPSSQPSAAYCGDYPCGPNNAEKVNVCHYRQTGNNVNAVSLCIPKTAVIAHLRQHGGDICGPCYLYI